MDERGKWMRTPPPRQLQIDQVVKERERVLHFRTDSKSNSIGSIHIRLVSQSQRACYASQLIQSNIYLAVKVLFICKIRFKSLIVSVENRESFHFTMDWCIDLMRINHSLDVIRHVMYGWPLAHSLAIHIFTCAMCTTGFPFQMKFIDQ